MRWFRCTFCEHVTRADELPAACESCGRAGTDLIEVSPPPPGEEPARPVD